MGTRVPCISFPRLVTVTSIALYNCHVTNISWPVLTTAGQLDFNLNIAPDDSSLFFPLSLTTITTKLSIVQSRGWSHVHLGGIQIINNFYLTRTSIVSVDAPSYLHGRQLSFQENGNLGSFKTAPLVVTNQFMIIGSPLLQINGLKLRAVGSFTFDGGNVTDLIELRTLQCMNAQISVTSCCPDLTTFSGDCLTSTSMDCTDCVEWTSLSPSSGPISGGQTITLTYSGIVKGLTVLLYFNNEDVLTCTRSKDRHSVHCVTPAAKTASNVTITLVNGRSFPIILPFSYQYVPWSDWAPVPAPAQVVPFVSSGIPGLPVGHADDATTVARTIMFSAGVALAVITILWIFFNCLCPGCCKKSASFDLFGTPASFTLPFRNISISTPS
jgi:hypothetical protein